MKLYYASFSVILVSVFTARLINGENSWSHPSVDFRDFLYAEIYEELAEEMAALTTDGTEVEGFLSTPKPLANVKASLKFVKPRQPESEDKVLPEGYQFVSGGAGEGEQHLKPLGSVANKQEVKSDDGLPAYCSPPNPCPKGKTAADGCQENIPDVAKFNRDYIERQMRAGRCTCDYEHMSAEFCSSNADQRGDAMPEEEINRLLDEILDGELDKDGNLEQSYKALSGAEEERNPFLRGNRLPVVAKKSPMMD